MSKMTKKSLPVRVMLPVACAVALALFAGVGIAQAQLGVFSDEYEADMELTALDVALLENGTDTSENDDALLMQNVPQGADLHFGQTYAEELAAKNVGIQKEYVRVVIHKHWSKDGVRDTHLDPSLIQLDLKAGSGDLWVEDASASTEEQTVLYSTKPLNPGEAAVFATGLRVDPKILGLSEPKVIDEGKRFVVNYDYDRYRLGLDVEVDAVQVSNAADAIRSAWGVDPAIIDASLVKTEEAQA